MSTADQRVDNQLYDLRKFAAQRGFEVVAEYTDVGISGSKARRPGLDAMLRDARKRKFSVLIVSAFDRLARSTKHSLGVVDELDSLGVEFVSRRENIATDGAMGRLFAFADRAEPVAPCLVKLSIRRWSRWPTVDEMRPLLCEANAEGKALTIDIFQNREGRPFLIHFTKEEQ